MKLKFLNYLFVILLSFLFSACGGKSSNEIRYVAIGASDATGVGANPLTKGYVFLIEDGLEASIDKEVNLVNLGIPGATADIIEDVELPLAKNANPDLVTIFMGGNDINDGVSVEDFGNRVRSVVQGIANDTKAFVVIATLPDVSMLPRFQEKPDTDVSTAKVQAYNNEIRSIANDFGVPIVDLENEEGYVELSLKEAINES